MIHQAGNRVLRQELKLHIEIHDFYLDIVHLVFYNVKQYLAFFIKLS